MDALPDDIESSLEGVGALRRDLRERAPGVGGKGGKKRMEWMKAICDKWGLGQMKKFNDVTVRKRILDEGWEKGIVLGPEHLEKRGDDWTAIAGKVVGNMLALGMAAGFAIWLRAYNTAKR